jgi:lysozyme
MLQNHQAFLAMLAHSEVTDRPPAPADSYRTVFGYRHVIVDLALHPCVSGEWHGERLADEVCIKAGLAPGCVSTAAGRYQIIKPTWLRIAQKLGLGNFGPDAQDLCALELLHECGAFDLIAQGRAGDAITKCKSLWASLPGNTKGQRQTSFADLMRAYTSAGGAFA